MGKTRPPVSSLTAWLIRNSARIPGVTLKKTLCRIFFLNVKKCIRHAWSPAYASYTTILSRDSLLNIKHWENTGSTDMLDSAFIFIF